MGNPVEEYVDCYQNLANAIILLAVKDYKEHNNRQNKVQEYSRLNFFTFLHFCEFRTHKRNCTIS